MDSGFRRNDSPGSNRRPSHPRPRTVADRPELVAFAPVRPGVALRQLASDPVEDAQLAERAGPVPARIIFVLGPVITIGAIFGLPGVAGGAAAIDQIGT